MPMVQNREPQTHVRELFGRNLRDARLSAGVSQEDLAQRTKVDRAAIGMFENGLSQPQLETLVRIKRALAVEMRQLLRGI